MNENMKKFLEEASKDAQFLEKVTKAETPEALIVLAAEKGFALTEEDLKPEERSGEVSDDELNAVAGGRTCGCALGGGGGASGDSKSCTCVMAGFGEIKVGVGAYSGRALYGYRCFCAIGGGGEDHEMP